MPLLTISLEAAEVVQAESLAVMRGLSVEQLLKELLVAELNSLNLKSLEDFFQKADSLGLASEDGRPLDSSEIYER